MSEDPTLKVRQDLTEIVDLAACLYAEAVNKSDDHDLPGGVAMIALGPVASPKAWEDIYEATEHWNATHPADEQIDLSHVIDEIENEAPVLQTLLFWSEAWRIEHDWGIPKRPSIVSEASFIRHSLEWAWENEVHFEDFARDISKVRTQLENVVLAGKRSRHGVQCFDCNVSLVQTSRDPRPVKFCDGHNGVCIIPHKFCPHDRGGLADNWHCPKCHRQYDVESYWRAVRHAHFVHADYLPLVDCSERTGVKPGTIKVWATRGKVHKRRDADTGRMTYHVGDVQERHADGVAVA